MSENQRLILAVTISLLIILSWNYFNPEKYPEHEKTAVEQEAEIKTPSLQEEITTLKRDDIIDAGIKEKTRITFENDLLKGSINLKGARLDDAILKGYHIDLDKNSPNIKLLSPSQTELPYFAEFGWVSGDKTLELPRENTLWQAETKITNNLHVITLKWKNSQGINFIIEFKLDDKYMFHVIQKVINNSNKPIQLKSYSLLSRNIQKYQEDKISHEGVVSVMADKLTTTDYEDIEKSKKITFEKQKGWISFSDKYWLTALIPDNSKTDFDLISVGGKRKFQIDSVSDFFNIIPQSSHESSVNLFVGAKKLNILDFYEKKYQITLFDRAVDFGMLYFITKPIFLLLSYFHNLIGNFGLAILLLTIAIKFLFFPLSYKSSKWSNQMKDLHPKIQTLKEKYKEDQQTFQKALMDLYKEEKVNPLAGCLPMLLQMPVFFALYKVLYVTIEMRHAPFFGWIKDLSAPDPTTIFNLFGLISWTPPIFLHIGALPIIMMITMFVQQKLSPPPTDPVQAKVMSFLPIVFVFMFSGFPAGLVIYWAWSNILSITEQTLIRKSIR